MLIAALAFALTACAPKDAAALVKEAESVISKTSDVSVTDKISLSSLKLTFTDSPIGTVTATLSGGDITINRETSGKNIDIEATASGIKLSVSPMTANMVINADAFKDVTFLFRMRVREESLSYYLLITGLDEVMSDLKEKVEITTAEPMQLDKRAVEVVRLLIKQPLLGNYSQEGEYDKKKGEYSYSYSDDQKINNELTRAINMLIGLDIDEMKSLSTYIESLFGSKDIEKIANDIVKHDKYNVLATVKNGKYGHYFNAVTTELSSTATLDNALTVKLLNAIGMDGYLSSDSVKATVKLNIKVNSDWSLSTD